MNPAFPFDRISVVDPYNFDTDPDPYNFDPDHLPGSGSVHIRIICLDADLSVSGLFARIRIKRTRSGSGLVTMS